MKDKYTIPTSVPEQSFGWKSNDGSRLSGALYLIVLLTAVVCLTPIGLIRTDVLEDDTLLVIKSDLITDSHTFHNLTGINPYSVQLNSPVYRQDILYCSAMSFHFKNQNRPNGTVGQHVVETFQGGDIGLAEWSLRNQLLLYLLTKLV